MKHLTVQNTFAVTPFYCTYIGFIANIFARTISNKKKYLQVRSAVPREIYPTNTPSIRHGTISQHRRISITPVNT